LGLSRLSLISCAIRVQPLWKQWTQWTQWTVFSLICVLYGHNGRCDTLCTLLPLNGVQEAGGSNPLAPTTETPSIEAFNSIYKKQAKNGADEILSIHISESLSATVKIAESAAKEFKDIPLTVHDSQQLSMGMGFQVELAARMAKAGKSMKAIIKALDDLMSKTFVAAGLDTL